MTGMSGAGKTTLARLVGQRLEKKGHLVEVIDGDEFRAGLCSDLGFSKEDRNTNIRRLGFVSKVLARNKVISIISAINPYEDVREELNNMGPNVKVVYIRCGLEKLKQRDTKGLYRKALLPDNHPEKIHNFTGISDPFEAPIDADLMVDTEGEPIEASAAKLEKFILRNI
jgi:adenylylsulfate kinase